MEKGRKFVGMVEKMHSLHVSEPMVAGDAFALHDATRHGR
jgi:hypothetical protein